jgi:NADH:ubiquinone oxidoreductase subunit 5 (subunit L)/multisubunit Na+/H+ antiporter MnhA subunit
VGLGAASAVLGVGFAVAQADFKRLLAYSSIENVGIIALGIGLAVVGRTLHEPALEALGLAGALFHVWNHALFKPLLFFVAGGLLHATGTRRMDLLGGLAPRMRRTALLAVLACLAVAALPPLNGFASEWLIYRALIGGVGGATPGDGLGLAAALLALVLAGGLALAAFVRFHGTVFLGEPRSPAVQRAHDPPGAMLLPMAALALACLAIGVLPQVALVPLRSALQAWAGSSAAEPAALAAAASSLRTIAATAAAAMLAGLALFLLLRRRSRSTAARAAGTWDCGYAAPSARMQYGGSSLARSLVDQLDPLLRSRRLVPALQGAFPRVAACASEVPDVVLDRLVLPALAGCSRGLLRLRRLQQGRVQAYVLYIAITILVLLFLA